MKRLVRDWAMRMIRWDTAWVVLDSTIIRGSRILERERRAEMGRRRAVQVSQALADALAHLCPDGVVRNGVFKGMRYPGARSVGSAVVPKLLGTYERELQPLLEEVCRTPYTTIVDVGCAEGYYAVGLAMRLPDARVYAYDTSPEARTLCQSMAEINDVADRVFVRERCDTEVLRTLDMGSRALVIVDCEGYEKHLLTPEVVPYLRRHDLLVEAHDFIDINISTIMHKLFEATHDIQTIQSVDDIQKAKTYLLPELQRYDLGTRRALLAESRPTIMEWLFIKAR